MILYIIKPPVIIAFILILIFLFIACSLKIVPNDCCYIIENNKRFYKVINPGFHFVIPFVMKIVKRISLNEQNCDFFFKDILTKDHKILDCGVTLTYKVDDPKNYYYHDKNIFNIIKECTERVANKLDFNKILASRDYFIDQIYLSTHEISKEFGMNVYQINVYFE